MKSSIKNIQQKYSMQILFAKENGYEAVLVPYSSDCDLICLDNITDEDYILEAA